MGSAGGRGAAAGPAQGVAVACAGDIDAVPRGGGAGSGDFFAAKPRANDEPHVGEGADREQETDNVRRLQIMCF